MYRVQQKRYIRYMFHGNIVGTVLLNQSGNNIVRYHFGSNAYRDEENKKDHKKDRFLVEAKQLVGAHCESAGGDGDGEEIMFEGVLV